MELDFERFFTKNYRVEQLSVYYGSVIPPTPYLCRRGDKLFDRFFYIVRGTFCLQTPNGAQIKAVAGDILYLPYDSAYISTWVDGEPGEYITVNFLLYDAANTIVSPGNEISLLLSDTHREHYTRFRELHHAWMTGAYGYSLLCASLFWNMLYHFSLSVTQSSVEQAYRGISEGILYLENHYTSDVTTDELAALCGVSASTFRRIFRDYKGMSPVKYKNLLKMRKARELLESGEYTVSEACEAVGCPDLFYFSKLFRQTYGINPSLCKTQKQSNPTNNA